MSKWKSLFAGGCVLLCPGLAAAGNGTGIDAQENVFGATNIHAVTGHGRLTAGISRDGDVTVLSWPNPSYTDQLGYISSNDLDAHDQPRFGAPEGAGMFLGLVCETQGGITTVIWLRDRATWEIAQDYGPTDGPNPHTRFTSAALGLEVELVDAIAPGHDTLVRDVRVELEAGSLFVDCALLSYANLSPLPPNARVPELPLVDWLFDGRNDFAAIWDGASGAVLHFHPEDQRVHTSLSDLLLGPGVTWGGVGEHLEETTLSDGVIESLLGQVESEYAAGAWAMVSTQPPPSQFQVGFDATPFCDQIERLSDNIQTLPDTFEGFSLPISSWALELFECWRSGPELVAAEGWKYPAADPWTDLQDGVLSGHQLAAGEVASALRTELEFVQGVAHASVIVGFGRDAASARSALQAGRSGTVAQDAEAALETFLEPLRIPGEPGTDAWRVARRALVNLRVGTSSETGAIVASIARQPPYALDWPRDGAFFNVMLDASGQSDLVRKRNALYAQWQRADAVKPTTFVDPPAPTDPDTGKADLYPADAWEMNHYADGMVGGTFRFEIDTTGFAVWTQVAHAGWAQDPSVYLAQQWPSIRSGANLLARWRDPATGLQAPAQEDDAAGAAQTLHGGVTVFGALDMAARGARLIGHDTEADLWNARAAELRSAMEVHYHDGAVDAFLMAETGRLPLMASGLSDTGPGAWLVWPMTMYDLDSTRVASQLAYDMGVVTPVLTLDTPGGLYVMKNTVSLAVARHDAFAGLVSTLPAVLASQATPDTDHFGEVMVVTGAGSTKRAEQRVSTPHLWESALFYLTALAVEDPGALQRYESVLPPSDFHAPPVYPDAGAPETGVPDAAMDGATDAASEGGDDAGDGGLPDADADARETGHEVAGGGSGCGCSLPVGVGRPPLGWLMLVLGALFVRVRRDPTATLCASVQPAVGVAALPS